MTPWLIFTNFGYFVFYYLFFLFKNAILINERLTYIHGEAERVVRTSGKN